MLVLRAPTLILLAAFTGAAVELSALSAPPALLVFLRRRCSTSTVVLLLLVSVDVAQANDSEWPAFLPVRQHFRQETSQLIEQTWGKRTFERLLRPDWLAVPLEIYAAVIDSPEVMAAAARHLGKANETMDRMGDGRYLITRPDGSQAKYEIIFADESRRVTLAEVQGVVYGVRVEGSVLGVLELSRAPHGIEQKLKVYVRIHNRFLAVASKLVLFLLPSIADAELSRGFTIAAAVAEWVATDPAGFCGWLGSSGLSDSAAAGIRSAVCGC